MQDSSTRSAETSKNEDAGLTIPGGKATPRRGVGGSLFGALALLVLDAAYSGSFLFSILVCPIWFLVSVLKNAVQRPGWRLAVLRMVIPAATLGLVWANNDLQWKIAHAHASQVVAACEEFHAANGRFPKTLDDLVPRYMPSIPRAKYCLMWGEFQYWNHDEQPMLEWCAVPPFGRWIYTFEDRRWGYLD